MIPIKRDAEQTSKRREQIMRNKIVQRLDFFLIAIALLSAILNMYNIWQDQTANAYYTAAVTSMLQSFHNFFFASFDPGGFVTVDKPPVTFWIQTISAYFFGVKGWSVILPQALAGVGSVLLMYFMVKPSFGKPAARIASLVFACTPIAAAVARTNNVDSLLVFTLLLGSWMLFRGIRREQWGLVVAAFGIIGLAFNIKMLQAYMVIPAFYLFYLFSSKVNWKKKLSILAAASVVLIVISISWAVTVDSISKENRPYIGSSQTNSVLELAFGYNGIQRLTGGGMPGGGKSGGMPPNQGQTQEMTMPNGDGSQNNMPDGNNGQMPGFDSNGNPTSGNMPDGIGIPDGGQGGPRDGGGGGGGAFNTGTAGPLRLFQSALSGQISWLLPFALIASVGLLAGIRRRKPLTTKQKESLFWLAWLLPACAFFSVAGFFHQYYLIMLAAPISALTGAGSVELWNQYRNKEGWRTWLLPTGTLVTTAFQLYILSAYTTQIGLGWSIGIGAAGTAVSLVLFLLSKKEKLIQFAGISAIVVLLAAPLYWAATPLLYGGNSMIPEAGPQLKSSGGGQGQGPGQGQAADPSADADPNATRDDRAASTRPKGGMGSGSVDTKLFDYLTSNNTGEKYLFATTSAGEAESYIIKTGKAVMAMGGFSGSDPILTVDKLKAMIANKEVKYFLLGGDNRGGSSDVTTWIKANSTEVPSEQWQTTTTSTSSSDGKQGSPMGGRGGSSTLYKINP
jgi:4-amino-4-deoxy-L-arabinose transferase-like glycosyltransferase